MVVALDFETYYSSDYSLSRMREVEYLLDPRFQVIMCAVKVDQGPNEVFVGHDAVAARFATIDWATQAAVSHNMRFDGAILSWHFGARPKLYLDTLSMARALTHSRIGKSALKAVAAYLELGEKGDEVVRALGKRLEDFSPHDLALYAGYCLNDNQLCLDILRRFLTVFPKRELMVIDAAVRMYIEPQVQLDPAVLDAHLADVQARQEAVFARVAHIDRTVFSSSAKFADLLREHGVELPMKISPATGVEIPALAKNDREFKELCEDHDQPLEIQALLAARLGAKSTIEETRTQSFLKLVGINWRDLGEHWMPVPLKYFGAHTGRFSGDGGYNFQNIKRGSKLKRAIRAPDGYRIVHRDSSQIEARMVAMLAGCQKLLDAFEQGRDVYSEFATTVYGRTINKVNKAERFVGKTGILGLGYQTGGEKLMHTLFIGNGGISVKIDLAAARNIVRLYRSEYSEIPDLWQSCEGLLLQMMKLGAPGIPGPVVHTGELGRQVSNRPVPIVEISRDAIWLPNGLCIAYPDLRRVTIPNNAKPGMRNQTVYTGPYKTPKTIYGGKVTENISQALARIVITDVIVRVKAETGMTPFMSTHDSLDYCVPVEDAPWWDDYLDRQFAIRPKWAPNLPLASEGGFGFTLADAEEAVNQ
jgi:hypothetical protein